MYEFKCHYASPKYRKKAKLCHTNIDSFTVLIKKEDIYVDIAKDVKTKFDISIYELERPLPKEIMKKFSALEAKTCSYLARKNIENKKSKRHKIVCHKRKKT